MSCQSLTKKIARRALMGPAVGCIGLLSAGILIAHEGHPPIPTTGVTVHGDELLLSPAASKAIGLQTAKVSLADVPKYVRANGAITVPWRQHAFVTSMISGVVESIHVRPGERVKNNQLLARISSLELETLQLDLLQATEDLALFEDRLRQQENQPNNRAIPDNTRFETMKNRELAAARVYVASQKLMALGFPNAQVEEIRSTGEVISRLEIRSPREGRIVHADIRVGRRIEPAHHLFHVIDNSVVRCVGDVLEMDSAQVRVGCPVRMEVPALGNKIIEGRVSHVDIAVDDKKRAVTVATDIDNRDGQLRPGMTARFGIQVGQIEQAIVCPKESVIRAGTKSFVLLQRGTGKFIRRKITLGRTTGDQVEVLNGLFPGDYVITAGTHLLSSLVSPSLKSAAKGPHPSAAPGLTAPGIVEVPASGMFFTTSLISGRIRKILVNHSEGVRAGQPLAEIESMELFSMQLALLEKQVELHWAERTLDRIRLLLSSGSVSEAEARHIRNEVRKLKPTVAGLQRRLRAVGLSEEHIARLSTIRLDSNNPSDLVSEVLRVHSPHKGRIAHFDLVVGQSISSGDVLFEIHDLSQAWLKVLLFEDQSALVDLHMSARAKFEVDRNLEVQGKIVRMAPTGEEGRIFPVWMELDAGQTDLKEGMLARVVISSESHTKGAPQP